MENKRFNAFFWVILFISIILIVSMIVFFFGKKKQQVPRKTQSSQVPNPQASSANTPIPEVFESQEVTPMGVQQTSAYFDKNVNNFIVGDPLFSMKDNFVFLDYQADTLDELGTFQGIDINNIYVLTSENESIAIPVGLAVGNVGKYMK